jgi:phage terminase large subunit-like protein
LANPALGDFRDLAEMRDFARKAKAMPSAEAAFRNLYLNQRVHSARAWITRQSWEDCKGSPAAAGRRFGGLDLSAKNDLTALAWVEEDDEDGPISTFLRAWKPAETIVEHARRDKAPYDTWVRSGQLLTTPGKVIHYQSIALAIAKLHAERPFTAIAFDRWRIDDLKRELAAIDCDVPLVPHGQGFKDMSPAIEALEDLIISRRLIHDGNPLLNMAVANATTTSDPAGGRKFDKMKALGRIDPVVALAMAVTAWKENRLSAVEASVYEERGIRTL